MEDSNVKEISRLVIGILALRIVQKAESVYCERFAAGKWNRLSANELHELFFDKKIRLWFETHSQSSNDNLGGSARSGI
jgi:hypothetical protein